MRNKTLHIIVTFHTTADAMALEKACKLNNIPGRIIPVPHVFSSGCGLAWCSKIDLKMDIQNLLQNAKIDFEGIYEYMM